MSFKDRITRTRVKDYVGLSLSFALAFLIWLLYNLSQNYSSLVQLPLSVTCELEGHENVSESSARLAARCVMPGHRLLSFKANPKTVSLQVEPEDMHHFREDIYYMERRDFTKYFHEIFSDDSQLEYFITDTLFFRFPEVFCRKVPVKPLISLSFRPQYIALGDLRISPDSVLLYGRGDVIGGIECVNTEVVSLDRIDADTYGEIRLKPVDGMRLSLDRVDYSINVVRYVEYAIDVPVVAEGVPKGVNFQTFPSSARLCIRTLYPASINFGAIKVSVKYSDYLSGMSGNCIGSVVNLPNSTLSHTLEPEVFNCFVQTM